MCVSVCVTCERTTLQRPFESFHALAICPPTLLTMFTNMHDYAVKAAEPACMRFTLNALHVFLQL